jgi:hypothetical protein
MSDPSHPEVADQVSGSALRLGRSTISMNVVGAHCSSFLVTLIPPAVGPIAAGSTRAKRVDHVMAMSVLVYALGMVGGFDSQRGGLGAQLRTFGSEGSLSNGVSIDVGGKEWGLSRASGSFLPTSMLTLPDPGLPDPGLPDPGLPNRHEAQDGSNLSRSRDTAQAVGGGR